MSQSQARPGPGLARRAVTRERGADDHHLALLDVAAQHLGEGAVADAEMERERGRLAVSSQHVHAPGGRAAAAATAAGAAGALALGRLDAGGTEAEGRVRHLQHRLLLVDDDAD